MYTLNKRTPAMLAHAAQHGLPKAEDFWVQKRKARRGSRALRAALGGGRFLPLQHYQVHGRNGLEG